MAGQTTVNGAGTTSRRPSGVFDSIDALGSDLGNLASLQMRLAVCDTKESLQRLTPSLVLGGFAILVMPASVVIGLLAVAYWLVNSFSFTPPAAFLLVAGAGLILSSLSLLFAIRLSRGSFTTFRRSSEEFQRNIAWIRTVMKHSGR